LETDSEICRTLLSEVFKKYTNRLFDAVRSGEADLTKLPGFLLHPEKIVIHIGKEHIGFEYYGPDQISSLNHGFAFTSQVFDYTQSDEDFFQNLIGFCFDGTAPSFPMSGTLENWVVPTNAAIDKLNELGWNYAAQNMVLIMNCGGLSLVKGKFCRLVNAMFFDAQDDDLKTRRIKWIDILPITLVDLDSELQQFSIDFYPLALAAEQDKYYSYPLPNNSDFKYSKLPRINRFIELWADSSNEEPKITAFLQAPENQFILTMRFGAQRVYAQTLCEWQNHTRAAIQPDFLIEQPNGYSDIVEFKLPQTKGDVIVGPENRKKFSAELAAHIAQTRVYAEYFEDPTNRKWVLEKHNIRVLHPKRIIVVGRRFHFDLEDWRRLQNDFKEVELLTYDDLVDGVVAQFYK
jgi:hypothetical protein